MGTMWGLARLAALGVALALAGCKTAENSLSQNDITAMKLTGVTVSYAPDASVQWEDGFRAYAAAKSIPDDQITAAIATPEGKAYVQNLLAPKIKAGVEKAMAGQLNGARPVRLDIVVKNFAIAGVAQRIVIGGGGEMTATANLADARTGAVIIANPELRGFLYAGQGLLGTAMQAAIDSNAAQSVADQVAERYGQNYRDWLLRRA